MTNTDLVEREVSNRAQCELRDLWGYTVVLSKNRNSIGNVWYENKIMGNGDGGNTLKVK